MNPFDHKPKVKSRRLNVLPENPDLEDQDKAVKLGRFPKWLHRKLPQVDTLLETQAILNENRLPTVCEEAKCPNLLECWTRKTATFLTMGKSCTRSCGFCDIDFDASPKPLEDDEPKRVADSVAALGLKHVVLTMVARDDVPDHGASHLAKIIHAIRNLNPKITIEVLTSDFSGDQNAWKTVLEAQPEIFNYNIETVERLSPRVRHKATYERTLQLLSFAKKYDVKVKSGLMVGLGESDAEVKETIDDLYRAGCHIITIGQYLQANRHKLRVKKFITPQQFEMYKAHGESIGVDYIYSGPFVRSSYNADTILEKLCKKTTSP